MIEENILWIVSILSFIDITLTYYLLWSDRRLNPKAPKLKELNPLASWIMEKTNYGPLGLLIGTITTQALIWGVAWSIMRTGDVTQAVDILWFYAGAISVAIWIHIHNINRIKKVVELRKMLEMI